MMNQDVAETAPGFERWESHRDSLLTYALKRLRDAARAEDAVQQTYEIAWARRGDYDPSRPMGPWLQGICKNVVHRSRTTQQNVPVHELRRAPEAPSAAEDATRNEVLRVLWDGIDQLPKPYRTIVVAALEGRKWPAVARALGKSPAAVRKSYSRALEHLRAVLPCGLGGSAALALLTDRVSALELPVFSQVGTTEPRPSHQIGGDRPPAGQVTKGHKNWLSLQLAAGIAVVVGMLGTLAYSLLPSNADMIDDAEVAASVMTAIDPTSEHKATEHPSPSSRANAERTTPMLVARVTWGDTEEPAADVTAYLDPVGLNPAEPRRINISDEGMVVVGDAPAGTYRLRFDRGLVEHIVSLPANDRLELALDPAIELAGQVFDAAGRPALDADIVVLVRACRSPNSTSDFDDLCVVPTQRGQFRLRGLSPWQDLMARAGDDVSFAVRSDHSGAGVDLHCMIPTRSVTVRLENCEQTMPRVTAHRERERLDARIEGTALSAPWFAVAKMRGTRGAIRLALPDQQESGWTLYARGASAFGKSHVEGSAATVVCEHLLGWEYDFTGAQPANRTIRVQLDDEHEPVVIPNSLGRALVRRPEDRVDPLDCDYEAPIEHLCLQLRTTDGQPVPRWTLCCSDLYQNSPARPDELLREIGSAEGAVVLPHSILEYEDEYYALTVRVGPFYHAVTFEREKQTGSTAHYAGSIPKLRQINVSGSLRYGDGSPVVYQPVYFREHFGEEEETESLGDGRPAISTNTLGLFETSVGVRPGAPELFIFIKRGDDWTGDFAPISGLGATHVDITLDEHPATVRVVYPRESNRSPQPLNLISLYAPDRLLTCDGISQTITPGGQINVAPHVWGDQRLHGFRACAFGGVRFPVGEFDSEQGEVVLQVPELRAVRVDTSAATSTSTGTLDLEIVVEGDTVTQGWIAQDFVNRQCGMVVRSEVEWMPIGSHRITATRPDKSKWFGILEIRADHRYGDRVPIRPSRGH